MLYQSDYMEEKAILQTAARMCAAARTAPKAHGRDTLHTLERRKRIWRRRWKKSADVRWETE